MAADNWVIDTSVTLRDGEYTRGFIKTEHQHRNLVSIFVGADYTRLSISSLKAFEKTNKKSVKICVLLTEFKLS